MAQWNARMNKKDKQWHVEYVKTHTRAIDTEKPKRKISSVQVENSTVKKTCSNTHIQANIYTHTQPLSWREWDASWKIGYSTHSSNIQTVRDFRMKQQSHSSAEYSFWRKCMWMESTSAGAADSPFHGGCKAVTMASYLWLTQNALCSCNKKQIPVNRCDCELSAALRFSVQK